MTEIHTLAESDRDEWLPLWHGYLVFYEEELSDAQTALTFERLTDPDYPVHGAIARDASGRAIGFVHWLTHTSTWAEGPYCYLEDLFVAPDVRGGGVGRALIATVKEWAGEAGCSQVYWLTQSHNTAARVLYDKVATDTGFVHYSVDLPGK